MGSLFTDLIDMLESLYGIARTQEIVDRANLENKGAFSAVGYYSRPDLESLLQSMTAELGGSEKEWLFKLGMYMSKAHILRNPQFYREVNTLYDFLLRANDMVRAKILTLYPDVEIPTFSVKIIDDNTLELIYDSPNRLGDLVLGWVSGKAQYFGEKVGISPSSLVADGSKVLFIIKRV